MEPAFDITFPAGEACEFPLHLVAYGEGLPVVNTRTDRDGNVRIISAGSGYALTMTNADTGESISTRSNGAVARALIHPDGSVTQTLTGHNLLILFPTDTPAGPSTTVHSGRVVLSIAPDRTTFTVRSVPGRELDVCAALSG